MVKISEWLNPITIDIQQITPEIVDWYRDIGGNVNTRYESKANRSSPELLYYLSYGNSKWCHIGTYGRARLHFCKEDANVALMFILKFSQLIQRHNMKELA